MLSRVTYHSYQRYLLGSQPYVWEAVTKKLLLLANCLNTKDSAYSRSLLTKVDSFVEMRQLRGYGASGGVVYGLYGL